MAYNLSVSVRSSNVHLNNSYTNYGLSWHEVFGLLQKHSLTVITINCAQQGYFNKLQTFIQKPIKNNAKDMLLIIEVCMDFKFNLDLINYFLNYYLKTVHK